MLIYIYIYHVNYIYIYQSTSVAQICPTLWDPMDCSIPGFPVHHQHPEFTQAHVHWVSDAIQPSHPLSSPSPPAFNLSQHQGLFKWVSSSTRWPKYLSFSFNISPANEHSGLISFKMDLLGLLAVQGTLKSLLQHHSRKALILLCSAFFIVQFSHPYMTNGKVIALTRWTFVGKGMSLLFNMLSRRRSQDGRGVGRGEHFLPYKFIKRAFKRRVNPTKQLLNAGRGHQAPRKAVQLFERREKKYSSIHQNIDTSFPNQETLTSHRYKPTHSEETPQ